MILLLLRSSSQRARGQRLTRASDRFSTKYEFEKPNDRRALDLMNAAAQAVMREISDLVLAYGVSDEYRYLLSHQQRPLHQNNVNHTPPTVSSSTKMHPFSNAAPAK